MDTKQTYHVVHYGNKAVRRDYSKVSSGLEMPDLTGWTRKDVAALWSITGFGFELSGEGVVTSQSVPAGTVVTKGTVIQVVFGN